MTDVPYREKFSLGRKVKIADLPTLEEFSRTWRYHNKLVKEQLPYHDQVAMVVRIGAYHGGDMLYQLSGVPGIWHECCLRHYDDAHRD